MSARQSASDPGGRRRRGVPWGEPRFRFRIAPVFSKGVQIGMGCTCYRHHDNAADRMDCKKMITFGQEGFSEDQLVAKLKLWLLAGFAIAGNDSRKKHVKLNARAMDEGVSDADLDARLAAMPDDL